ncbi:alpha/beta fold hydrolase [Williamsia maris]|uniref:Pimeloyl-ACP methyl ester carboxylesterase n=1 Tax=Williamsia maris TaxID=72806 RepID=A0ABT1HI34_9NOCA|nr:alpha/beta hydrolase [Williamsia maris]MCP2177618.1 Pimeloyl-ACP methyl ester carboxylesterase [Williamsia maris]
MPALGTSGVVPIGDREVHYCADGQGPVTVFFESGLGRSRNTWAAVQPQVARFARTITYDRAGHGRSDSRAEPCTLEELTADHLAVRRAVVDGPCVVVGHSYGGPIVRAGALVEPADVSGVVLVDEVSELCDRLVYGNGMMGSGAFYRAQVVLAKLRLLPSFLTRTHYRTLTSSNPVEDPDELMREIRSEEGSGRGARTALREWQGFTASMRRFHASGPWIPRVPMTTISPTRVPEDKRHLDYIAQSHDETARLACDCRHVFAHTSGHYIQLSEPDTVVNEIRALVDASCTVA